MRLFINETRIKSIWYENKIFINFIQKVLFSYQMTQEKQYTRNSVTKVSFSQFQPIPVININLDV